DWPSFLENLAHLALKAPETPETSRLMKAYTAARKHRRSTWVAVVACCLTFVASGIVWSRTIARSKSRATESAAATITDARPEPVETALLPVPADAIAVKPQKRRAEKQTAATSPRALPQRLPSVPKFGRVQ